APERSRAFDDWFGGSQTEQRSFADLLAPHDQSVHDRFTMAWEQVVEGYLPTDCAIDQLPQHIEVRQRHYNLSYKAILEQETLRGALLVVSDVTDEMERIRRDAEQRELISVFERIMRDRTGFAEFFKECEGLVGQVVGEDVGNPQ